MYCSVFSRAEVGHSVLKTFKLVEFRVSHSVLIQIGNSEVLKIIQDSDVPTSQTTVCRKQPFPFLLLHCNANEPLNSF
jgi:hypothetical protein